MQRRETYGAIVPPKAVVLTAGVDVQANRIEMEVVGWGHGEESWGIDYRVLFGDIDQPEVWDKLTEALGATYPWAGTDTRLRISTIAIDASYRTQMVYSYVRTGPPNVFAVMGFAGAGRPIVAHLSKRESGATRAKVRLYSVGVDGAKDVLMARLRKAESGPGACHFPSDRPYYSAEYFQQLTAEKKVTRYHRGFARHEWIKIRPRNEALDVRVYAMAALYVLNPVYEAYETALRDAADPSARAAQAPARDDDDWVDGWRR
jgi:phage terminase large subunit GpA-like protein